MDSETDTDTISLCDSETSRENYKSPESSDCEGYATPLASSLTDISNAVNHGITINVPDDMDDETSTESGERTPVSTPRAISPPIVKQTMYLQKPRILVMTQREIQEESSEDEFFDADVQIRDVAQQLLDGVSDTEVEERADTPIAKLDLEELPETETEEVVSEEDEGCGTPVQIEDIDSEEKTEVEESVLSAACVDDEIMNVVNDVTEDIVSVVEVADSAVEKVSVAEESEMECIDAVHEITSMTETHSAQDIKSESESCDSTKLAEQKKESDPQVSAALDEVVEDTVKSNIEVSNVAPVDDSQTIPAVNTTFDNCADNIANNLIKEDVLNTQTPAEDEKIVVLSEEAKIETPVSFEHEIGFDTEKISEETEKCDDATPVHQTEQNMEECVAVVENKSYSAERLEPISQECVFLPFAKMNEACEDFFNSRPTELYEQMPEVFSEITIANTPLATEPIPSDKTEVAFNQETMENEPMTTTTLINSDEVKTSTADDMFSDCSPREVKVDFDGYSSGKEESLSSSTSTESFEFAEPVSSNHVQDEKTQALRNSIIERYPSNETDDDELDSVGDDFDEDLLAVKQISAEVEQLVAAINAFGRDEEQQMSAYLVGKKMAAEKKRKSAMDTGVVVTSPYHDQTVQTDNDSFVLVDRHIPVAMESLQVEIDKLQADLEKVKSGEKELLKINTQLKLELDESQQTIDGIEVEAEQQYTELTSEIDELCEIVQRKDQELAIIKEKVANLSVSESNLKDDIDSQRIIVQRQKEIIESLREELDAITKKLGDVTKARDKAMEEATVYKMKNMERDRFLSREAQMSMEIEDLQRELNKQKLILNQTSMAKLADTFDRKVLHLENELRERDMLICKQNQIINSHRKSPTGSVITHRKMQPRASVLAAAGILPSAGSSSESFQNGLDADAKEALLSFILSDRHNQLANIYNIGRILDLSPQEERSVERHLTKDRFA